MGSDVSRDRFDALRHYTGVRLQQGRVLLDADWNEQASILERRLRANALDLGSPGQRSGIAGVAVVPRTTPDAFRIEVDGGDLTIGLGRMYVDGLLAENHGDPADGIDSLLRERVGSDPITYTDQPHWPDPAELPDDGRHLVYLDVWEREVTPLEAPDLVEPALGVDTTTRLQTVWQVRLLPDDGADIDCSTPDAAIPGWSELIAPSGGRLTTGTVPVDADDDPCELPPTGGYRGPENQTYRVEVHDGGAVGTATFKWSRDNGSVASRVVEVVSPSRLRPASLGRDDVLRLRTGDWVEVLDDHRELDQRPGELRRIEVHQEDGTISFDDDLPAELVLSPDQAAARNLRVRRWDQAGEVVSTDGDVVVDLDAPGAAGTVPVPADGAAVVLEHGITVTLSTDDGVFRSGDHWIFVARTTDASVEQLVDEPPLGVHHHYARLAMVDLPDTEADCRVLWPPEPGEPGEPAEHCGQCSVCVTPESHATGALTIQDAVDDVRHQGGTVCLAAGRYQLDEPVDLTGARSVRITGQGPRTLVTARQTAFLIERALAVTIEELAVLGGGVAPLVDLRTTVGVSLRRLALVNAAGFAGRIDDGAEGVDGVEAVRTRSEFGMAEARAGVAGLTAPAIALSSVAIRPQVRDCLLVGPAGVVGGSFSRTTGRGHLLTAAMEISTSIMVTQIAGVALLGSVAHFGANVVRDNTVMRCRLGGLGSTGVVAPGGSLTISGNTVAVDGIGVAVGPSGCEVRGNTIDGPDDPGEGAASGIVVTGTMLPSVAGTVRILDNHVRDVAGAGISVRVAVDDLVIRGNHVTGTAHGILMEQEGAATSASIAHNTVRDVGAREGIEVPGGAVGIGVQGVTVVAVESNVLDGVGTDHAAAFGATGIRVLACTEPRVLGNAVARVGPEQNAPPALGIHVGAVYGQAVVSGNTVRRSDREVDEDDAASWTGIMVGASADTELGTETRHVEASGERAWVMTPHRVFALDVRRSRAVVDGNIATGTLRAPAAVLRASGELTVSGNQLRQPREAGVPALRGTADSATVQGNHATGGEPSIELDVDARRVAVVANLVSTGIVVDGAGLQPPWAPLNPGGI